MGNSLMAWVRFPLRGCALRGRGYTIDILAKDAIWPAQRRGCEVLKACTHFITADFHVERSIGNIKVDDVAFANRCIGSTDKGFGSDVAGGEAARGGREAAIGEESDGGTELGIAADGSGDLKHLAHARSAFGAFIA